MVLNFPATPAEGDVYGAEGATYTYKNNRWTKTSDAEAVPVEIVDASVSGNGWQVWGDVLIQWNNANTTSGGATTIILDQPYDSADKYRVVVTSRISLNRLVTVDGKTATQFDVYGFRPDTNSDAVVFGFDWFAIGEAPDALKKPKEVSASAGGGGGEAYPVGAIFMSTIATAPDIQLGYGTWQAYGQGRAIIGVGNNGESDWAAGETRGSETHTLTEAEMPAHGHTGSTNSTGSHTHGSGTTGGWLAENSSGSGSNSFLYDQGPNTGYYYQATAAAGTHSHTVTINSAGSGGAHNNVPPSIACYMWERTA